MRKLASLVIVIDPQMLGNPLFSSIMSTMVNELRAVKLMPGVDKVLAPNDPQIAYKEKMFKRRYSCITGISYQYLIG